MIKAIFILLPLLFFQDVWSGAEEEQQKTVGQIVNEVMEQCKTWKGMSFTLPDFHFETIVEGKGENFMMGSPRDEPGRNRDEGKGFIRKPVYVEFTNPFEMMTTEVTQQQWVDVMGYNPSYFQGRDFCGENYTVIEGKCDYESGNVSESSCGARYLE